MRAVLVTTCLVALAACSEEAPAQEATKVSAECKDIVALATAISEPKPFESLRTGNVMLGDYEVEDQFTTDVTPAGGECSMGEMSGWNPGDADTFVVNCGLFSSGVFDREENAVKAKAAFDAAKKTLGSCLPSDWQPREGPNNGDPETEVVIFETAADKVRSEGPDAYLYPVELRKEFYTGSMRGGKSQGWNVTLNFQASGAAPAAE